METSTKNASGEAAGVSRSGRVRKKSLKLAEYALTDEINALFNWKADMPQNSVKRMKFEHSTGPDVHSNSFSYVGDDVIDVKDEPLEVESRGDTSDGFLDVCIKEEDDIKNPLLVNNHFTSFQNVNTSQLQAMTFCYAAPKVESVQPTPPLADPPSTGTEVSEGLECGGPSCYVPEVSHITPPGYSDPPSLSSMYDTNSLIYVYSVLLQHMRATQLHLPPATINTTALLPIYQQMIGHLSPQFEALNSDPDQDVAQLEDAQSTEESDSENYMSDELFNSDLAVSDKEYTETSEASGDDETVSDPSEADTRCKWVSGGSFVPQAFDFDGSNSGIKANSRIDSKSTELDIFLKFFDSSLVDLIVTESNRYYTQLINTRKFPASSIMNKWTNTNRNEMYTFLALVMLMAYTKKHRIRNYWTKDPIFETPMFRKVMPKYRFCLLLKMLNFVNSTGEGDGDILHRTGETHDDHLHSTGEGDGDTFHSIGERHYDYLHGTGETHDNHLHSTGEGDSLHRTDETHDDSLHSTGEAHVDSLHNTGEGHDDSPHRTGETHDDSLHSTGEIHDDSLHPTGETHNDSLHPTGKAHDDSLLHTGETHDDSLHRTVEARDDSLRRTGEAQGDSLRRTGEAHDSHHITGEAHDASLHSTGEAHDDSLHRTGETHNDSLHRTGETHDDSPHRTVETHDDSLHNTGEAHDDSLHRTGETHDDNLHSTGEAHDDSLHSTGDVQGDSLHKIRPIYSMLKTKFGQLFQPFQNLLIDGRLVMWKGRQSFKRYIPKCHGSGVRLFVLCDCETEYILDFIAYTGANSEVVRCEELGLSGAVVQTLMQTYLGKGHNLYLDSWCSSLKLFGYLRENKTGACGLVRTEKKCMPVFKTKMKKGECQSFHANNILALKWCGNRDMRLLSTVHKIIKVDNCIKMGKYKGQKLKKPRAVVDYITNVRQIDKCHLQSSSVDCVMKKAKWHVKLFFHLLDMVVLNTYTLYQVATGKTPVFTDFQLRLIRQLLQEFMCTRPQRRPKSRCRTVKTTTTGIPLRLTSRHFPRSLPLTNNRKTFLRKRCFLCRSRAQRKESRFYCEECGVALCLVPCFEDYHTLTVL